MGKYYHKFILTFTIDQCQAFFEKIFISMKGLIGVMKDIVIFSIRIANELIKSGFPIKRVGTNKKDNIGTVFYFQNTPEIVAYLKTKENITLQ